MVKMRIPIREQLGCLVLLASLIGLAVISVATWITNHNFVLRIRSTRLTLTASLKTAQVASNLLLMRSTARQTALRLAIQTALRDQNNGQANDTTWARSRDDLDAVFSGNLAVQAQIYGRDSSAYSVFNATSNNWANVKLPILRPNGQNATLGDKDYGFIPELYPKFDPIPVRLNESFNSYYATFNGASINRTKYLISGPYQVNETLSLLSVTMPIINNTSNIETLGWLTTVLNADLIMSVVNSNEGLDDTGISLLIGPNNSTNRFQDGIRYNSPTPIEPPENQMVRFLISPSANKSEIVKKRHNKYGHSMHGSAFDWALFPAIRKGYTHNTNIPNNAGSQISTRNEEGDNVAVGYAVVSDANVDWMIVVEQSHSEVWAPINNLRNVILACVFGTMGVMMLLAFPVAHYSSRPIRRLRDATKRSISPHVFEDDSLSSNPDGPHDEGDAAAMARKEGWLGQIVHYRRNQKATRAERREAERRRQFRIPAKVKDRKHFIHDELTDLTKTFNEMTDELMMQYEKLEERVQQRTAELELSKKAAEAANESKTLFIANISHELKTPLNGILGMCAVCMSEDDPVKLRRSLGIIYKSGDLLLNLLTDLLTFSKNQSQNLTLDEKDFRLRDISSQVFAIFERQAKESGIKLSITFEGPYEANLDENGRPSGRGDLGPFGLGRLKDMILYGDQHRILQVVINLVSNSLKFTPKGGFVTTTIRCLGEANMTDSRKASLQSRQSSMRNSKTRIRASSSEVGSISVAPSPNIETANVINAMEKPNAYSHILAQERAATPPPGRWLAFEFEVEDTGPGIPANLHDKIFEPFVQGDLGLSKKYGGTGLGLSICSQLAGLMKGSIRLQSEVGRGSVFTMMIPLKHLTSRADSTASSSNINLGDAAARRSESFDETRTRGADDALSTLSVHSSSSNPVVVAAAAAAAASSSSGPVAFETDAKPRLVGLSQPFFASNPPLESPNSQAAAMQRVEAEATKRGDKVKVLVAEDNKTNQEVVLRMLKLEDVYDVTVAKDGQEALDKVKESMERQTPYNLIFMDVQMPNLDGLQSTRLIRQSGFSAPIVALTAYAEESNVKECLDSGMDFFLSKPIRRPALKHVLKTYCPPIPEEEGEGTISGSPDEPSSGSPNGRVTQPTGPSSSEASTNQNANAGMAPTTDKKESPSVSPLTTP